MRMRIWLVLFFGPVFAGASQDGNAAKPARPIPAIERVMIVSVDGLRPDCALRANMPVLRSLMREGAFTFWARTTAVAITLPSHTSMVTGVAPEKHGVTWNKDLPAGEQRYPAYPTVMELAQRAGYVSAMVAGKSKFAALNQEGTITHAFVPAPEQKANSSIVTAEAVKTIEAYKPDLLFVHFPDADGAGHAHGWGSPEQIAAIERVDAGLGEIVAALERTGLRTSTLIVVTADHGGAGLTHGGPDPRSQHIPWIAAGPGTRKNFDLTQFKELAVRTEDTCATACYVLGLAQQPYFDGTPVMEAFEGGK